MPSASTTSTTESTPEPGEMLAVVNTPNGPAVTALRSVPEPETAADTAVIEVHAFSLNRGELALLAARPEGWRPGQDIAGVVVTPAADGSGPRPGTRVIGLVAGAGWSQRIAAPTTRLAPLPDTVDFALAAALPLAGLTALRTLRLGGALLGKRVLVTGATGGVGSFAVQLAERAGARTTGVTDATEAPNELFDLILESVGGPSLTAAINRIAPSGTVVVFGNSLNTDAPLNVYQFVGHEGARLQTYFSYASGPEEEIGMDLGVLVTLLAQGVLSAEIGAQMSWRELDKGMTALRDRRVVGKVIFKVD